MRVLRREDRLGRIPQPPGCILKGKPGTAPADSPHQHGFVGTEHTRAEQVEICESDCGRCASEGQCWKWGFSADVVGEKHAVVPHAEQAPPLAEALGSPESTVACHGLSHTRDDSDRSPPCDEQGRRRGGYVRRLLVGTALMVLTLLFYLYAGGHAKTETIRNAAITSFESRNYARAMNELRPLMDAGDAKAQEYVGFMYLQGFGVSAGSDPGGKTGA